MSVKEYISEYFWRVYLSPISLICLLILMAIIIHAIKNETLQSKKYHMKNIFWMSVSNFFLNLRYCLPIVLVPQDGTLLCQVSGISFVFFSISTASWYFTISCQIIQSIWHRNPYQCIGRAYISHIYVWVISIIVTISIPREQYGLRPDTNTCNINTDKIYELFLWIPASIYLAFSMILLCTMCYTMSHVQRRPRYIILLRTSIFVGVFVITWFPLMLYSILDLNGISNRNLAYTALICVTSSGILNLIVWMFTFSHIPGIYKWMYKKNKNSERVYIMTQSDLLSKNARELFPSESECEILRSEISTDDTGTYERGINSAISFDSYSPTS